MQYWTIRYSMESITPVRMTLNPVPSTTSITPFALISQIMVKIYTGRKGMITFSIVSFTISPNSSNPFLRPLASVKIMPTPMTNESTRAVMISQIGGIFRSMYGRNSFSDTAADDNSPVSRYIGNMLLDIPYENNAPHTVEQ